MWLLGDGRSTECPSTRRSRARGGGRQLPRGRPRAVPRSGRRDTSRPTFRAHGRARTPARSSGAPRCGSELSRDRGRIGRELLVAHFERSRLGAARRGHVPSATPRQPGERRSPASNSSPAIGLDPEARVRPVRDARVVDARLLRAKPRLLEQRAGHVSSVPDDVHDPSLREGELEDERRRARARASVPRPARSRRDPTRRATARILRRRRAASSGSSAASSGTAALTGATSPRSTKPGSDPIAPARNVVPERGDPMTNTSRSSSLPSRSRSDAPRLGASRFATRSWRAAESSRLGTVRFSQPPTIDTPRVLVDSVGTTRDGTQRRAGLKR